MDLLTSAWLEALERRHLADLTMSEVARALRALSSCYVERRARLAEGGALSSAGKRAAFALFYGPQHLLVTQEIVNALPRTTDRITDVIDLGCGTGSAGAAWALAAGSASIRGLDRHPWAIAEASWTYRQFHLQSRVIQANIAAPDMTHHKRERHQRASRHRHPRRVRRQRARARRTRAAADAPSRRACAGGPRPRDRAYRSSIGGPGALVDRLADRRRARRRPRRRVAVPCRPSADPTNARACGRVGPARADRPLALPVAPAWPGSPAGV